MTVAAALLPSSPLGALDSRSVVIHALSKHIEQVVALPDNLR